MRFFYVFLALLGYLLPLVANQSAGLTFHALDLAEWTSTHPLVRAETPALLTALLLRFPLMCLGVLLAIDARTINDRTVRRLMYTISIVIMFVSLPPLDFITRLEDRNYQQQLGLGLAGLALIFIVMRWQPPRWVIGVVIVLAFAALSIGWVRAIELFNQLGLSLSVGFGGILTLIGLSGRLGWLFVRQPTPS
jgi:amino acid transporter